MTSDKPSQARGAFFISYSFAKKQKEANKYTRPVEGQHGLLHERGGALWARPAQKLEKLQICLNWAIYGSKWIYVYLLCIFSQFPTFLGWLISIISPVINKVSFYTVCTQ